MTTEQQTESEGFETRTYAEIAKGIETQEDSSETQTKTPEPGATQEEDTDDVETTDETSTDDTSQPEDEPQTLEEARVLLAKARKEAQNAQAALGRQGNELGDIRKEIAELKASKPEPKPTREHKSYVDLFNEDEAFKGMNAQSKEYLGKMFDMFEGRILEQIKEAPEISKLRSTVEQQEIGAIQTRWEQEAAGVIDKYGKGLMDKHGPEIAKQVEGMVKRGVHPDDISVTKIFRELAFDDIAAGNFKKAKPHPKDELNARAGPKKSTKAPATRTKTDYSGMNNKDAFNQMLKEDGIM